MIRIYIEYLPHYLLPGTGNFCVYTPVPTEHNNTGKPVCRLTLLPLAQEHGPVHFKLSSSSFFFCIQLIIFHLQSLKDSAGHRGRGENKKIESMGVFVRCAAWRIGGAMPFCFIPACDVTIWLLSDMLSFSTLPSESGQQSSLRSTDPICHGTEKGAFDFSKFAEKSKPINLDHQRSLEERSLSELLSPNLMSPRPTSKTIETVKSSECLEGMFLSAQNSPCAEHHSFDPHPMIGDAWEALRKSLVYFRGKPVGTIAALDPSEDVLNYNQVFVRDFFPSALAFLMNGEPEIVKNFLLKTLRLQAWEKRIDCFTLGEGVMPASFKVLHDPVRDTDTMIADFGESAIGRVAPIDSGFWWIILLRAYTKSTGDHYLAEMADCQRGMRLILTLCLSEGFDTFPTLLCADGCCMVDRRMGVYGYPIEIQALFFMALRCARILLKPEGEGKEFIERIDKRLHALSYHMRSYFWLDFQQLNNIYRYKTEEYSHTAVNKFNVIPDSIPDWVLDFMPIKGGYFIGNVSPARMDFRWFCLGNCIAILSSLATPEQSMRIMDLIEERWVDLVGEMPLKVSYPALEGHEWRIVTGCDPKNTRWSYHNGGSWPVLLWLLTAACVKTGRPQMARRAIELAENRLSKDGWPEYYDGKLGRYIGKQARKWQTWSVAGYLVAKMMLEDPSHLVGKFKEHRLHSILRNVIHGRFTGIKTTRSGSGST
ncbi:probable alkaline/neutral invertase F isoform X2 [Cryptomeria japonica]|uniref:probable alkaline/neutral invertase F isoform X2 n=1 Tax=Cryptomeria japonica TaxID=3369 RepID=UPI0027DA0EA0|nr:probable alkaline/neutral invertase F isoform X2 [Cryptomeria japonica]